MSASTKIRDLRVKTSRPRLSVDEGIALFDRDLLELGAEADEMRRELHPEGHVTFVRDRIINYTNVCITYCKFCAFYRPPGHAESYVRTKDEIFKKVEEMLERGGKTLMLQGGHNPELKMDYFEDLFSSIKSRFPSVYLHSMTATEVDHLAEVSGLDLHECMTRLHQAGLDSLPGGGAEMLVDDIREAVSPRTLAERGINSILLEGGSRLNGSMLDGGYIDRVAGFVAPILVGGQEAVSPIAGSGVECVGDATKLREVGWSTLGADLLIEGYLWLPSDAITVPTLEQP